MSDKNDRFIESGEGLEIFEPEDNAKDESTMNIHEVIQKIVGKK